MRRWSPVVVAALTAPLLLAGCGGEPAAPREGVSAEELTGDVSGSVDLDTARVGGALSLKGQVVSVPGPTAFELRAVDGATERPVLVLNRHDRIDVDDVVQVAGTVRVLDDRLAEEYALTDGALLSVHDGKRVVVARTADTDVPGDGQ
ncbi:MAG TPA: hypothetical protein VNU66_00300 [Mycobacteriales bacterium]|nr:hypothetical protein [Mycobacteriales bacterium]